MSRTNTTIITFNALILTSESVMGMFLFLCLHFLPVMGLYFPASLHTWYYLIGCQKSFSFALLGGEYFCFSIIR